LDSILLNLAGITEGSSLVKTLHERRSILRLNAASRRAVLQPQDPGGLSAALRSALATRMAAANGERALAAHYRAMLDRDEGSTPDLARLCDPATAPLVDAPWLEAVVQHADLLTNHPQDSTAIDIERLRTVGVDDADTVRLTQLAGFVSHEVRFLVGLRLLNELGAH